MENEGIITEEDISFGARATKVNGKWDDDEPVEGKLVDFDGKTITTTEFVEGIIIFRPKYQNLKELLDKITNIVEFIEARATKKASPHLQIHGSWEVPDNRVKPKNLFIILEKLDYKIAVANFLRFDEGNLIALKQESTLESEKWEESATLINPLLYGFLSEGDVLP